MAKMSRKYVSSLNGFDTKKASVMQLLLCELCSSRFLFGEDVPSFVLFSSAQ